MATMVHGQWADTLNRKRQTVHLHQDGSKAGFGPTACGIRVRPTSAGRTTHLHTEVTCGNCRRQIPATPFPDPGEYPKATKGATTMNTARFIEFAHEIGVPYAFDGGTGRLLFASTNPLAAERFNIGNRLAEELGAKHVKITSYADGSAIVETLVSVGG